MLTLGPKLPYDLSHSGMVITKLTKRIILLGGESLLLPKTFNSMLELVNDLSEWKEVGFPELKYFRKHHLALYTTLSSKMNFCGKCFTAKIPLVNTRVIVYDRSAKNVVWPNRTVRPFLPNVWPNSSAELLPLQRILFG